MGARGIHGHINAPAAGLGGQQGTDCRPVPGHRQPVLPCRYTDIFVGQPQVEEDYITSSITPQQCRLRDMTYAAPITVDVEYTRGKEIVVRKGKDGVGAVYVGRIPLMLRCDRSADCLPALRSGCALC